jgi:hypothetical protein
LGETANKTDTNKDEPSSCFFKLRVSSLMAITITRNGESGKGIGERGMGNANTFLVIVIAAR